MVTKMEKELTLREKICQTVIVKADPEEHIKQFGSIENFMKQYPVGGLFVGGEICPYNKDLNNSYNVAAEYQKYSKVPLIICIDGENGAEGIVDDGFMLPPFLCLGAANDKQLAYDYGKAIAQQAVSEGINWTFAPVADLCINHQNLVINGRSMGDDVNRVATLYRELVRGYKENGLLTTAKHFPGDGVDYRNQHIVRTVNSLSKKEWEETSGKMFKVAIEAGVDAIMPGHISCPALQNDAVDGIYPPATLSYDLITKVLKGEMGFEGVVVSDALDMGGFLRWIYEQDEAEVKCFEIGVDMLLWPQLRTIDNIEKKLLNGEIPMERLEDAYSRIMKMKNKISKRPKVPDAVEFAKKTAEALAQKGTCVLRNSGLPIDKNKVKKIRLVGVSTKDIKKELGILKEEMEKRGAEVEVLESWCNYHADFSSVNKDYDLLIFAYMLEKDIPDPVGEPAVTIHTSLVFDRDKTIIASFTSPYILNTYCETAKNYINSYSDETSLRTFVKGIYGETELTGTPSVKII
ncbi:MAG: glycoside hydrolase family 3 N-terminal domain-containing protein [Clostridia bacterium]|nr:glycoside hydrolase family 3 N-terminal domain-containing protein [Clostridia bacterium]